MLRIALLLLLISSPLLAQDAAAPDPTRVSVLGYHDFTETGEETQMKLRVSKFREQMQRIQDLGLSVISMPDFQAWKAGEKEIPAQSIVITLDDGWKSVYTHAFPILKEFNYPFTIFLYKDYVDGGGRALTTEMIEEMMDHGATIGSHSVTHPYPSKVKQARSEGTDRYDEFLRREMGESKRYLEATFGEPVTTYAYPGGFQTSEMFGLAEEFGYRHLFTVLPGKVRRDSENHSLPRYIVLGTHDHIFDLATKFRRTPGSGNAAAMASTASLSHPVNPEPGAIINERMPRVEVDLSGVTDLDPDSLVMKIDGFGTVPATYDPVSHIFSWTINRRLRTTACQVHVSWDTTSGASPERPLRWTFRIDREAAYVPRIPAQE